MEYYYYSCKKKCFMILELFLFEPEYLVFSGIFFAKRESKGKKYCTLKSRLLFRISHLINLFPFGGYR